MTKLFIDSRRLILAAISLALTGGLTVGLVSPSFATTWQSYGIPDNGIVVMQPGNKGYAITPMCQPRLNVIKLDGSQGSHGLNMKSEYFPEIGLTGCYTELGNVQSSDSFSWWTVNGTTPAEEMPIVRVTDLVVTSGNKTINLTWNVSNNAEWIDRYWFYFERRSVGGLYSKMVSGQSLSATLNVVANSDDWKITMVPRLKFNGRTSELVFDAAANITPLAPAAVSLQPGDKTLSVFFEPGTNDPAKIASYVIRVSPGDAEFKTNKTSLTITSGIENNVDYQVSVRAVNAVGYGEWTDSNRVTTRSVPKLASNVSATAVGERGARVTWTAASGDVTGYRITSVATGEVKVVSSRENAVVFTDVVGALPRSPVNTFYVATLNDYLTTVPSATTTTAFTPDRAAAVVTSGAKNAIEVTWSEPADIETPIVKYSAELIGANNNVVSTIETTNPFVTFENLTSGDRYRARIFVHTAWGHSTASVQSNQSTVQGVPSAPTNATVRQIVNSDPTVSIQLGALSTNGCAVSSWSVVASWVENSGSTVSQELSSVDPDESLTFTKLIPGKTHSFALTATNCWGTSPVATYTVIPQVLPEPVTNVKLALSATGDLTATWSPSVSKDVTSVLVTFNPGNISYRVSASTTKVILSEPALGQMYQVSITARNSAGNSKTATIEDFLVALAPGQVNEVSVTVDQNSAIAHISWAAPEYTGAQILGYRIWITGRETQDVSESWVTLDNLVGGDTYSVTIMALSNVGNGLKTTTQYEHANDLVVEASKPEGVTSLVASTSPALVKKVVGQKKVVTKLDTLTTIKVGKNSNLKSKKSAATVTWKVPKTLKKVKKVLVQKKVGTKWKTIATVEAKSGKYPLIKSKNSDSYRVKAIVSKKKQVSLKIKVVRK